MHEIVVLVENVEALPAACAGLTEGQILWRREDASPRSSVTVESIHRFKGLESPFVILVPPRPYRQNVSSLIVGISRAMVKCIVIAEDDETLDHLKRRRIMDPDFRKKSSLDDFIADDDDSGRND